MRLAPLALLLTVLGIGCTRDNPAFEGGDEFADDNGTFETRDDDEQDASSADESGSADQDSNDSNTIDGTSTTTSDDESTTTNDDSTSSSSDDSMSSSDDAVSTSESSSDEETTNDTVDPLDGPIEACPITDIFDCKTCIQAHCCFEESDMGCLDNTDQACTCVLSCLIDTKAMADCASACEADPSPTEHANQMYTCSTNFCDDWCL
jgi:hypothetical protein